MEEHKNNASIIYRKDLTLELGVFRIAPDSNELPLFEAGQYAEIALPELDDRPEEERRKMLRRPYSIASSPTEREYLEMLIVLVGDGAVTPKLWSLPVGGRVWLGPKIKGKFTLQDIPEGKDIVMVSTGTGLAPFVSMVRQHLHNPHYRSFTIIHGARYAADLAYKEELEILAKNNPKFSYLSAVTREEGPWEGHRGRVQQFLEPAKYEAWTGRKFNPADMQIFLCGNPAMIDELTPQLIESGCKEHHKKDPGNIHFERFW